MVAKGYSRVQGLDYKETFIPITRTDSIIIVLEVAASKRWEVHHMDVKISFLHDELKDESYMKQPEEYYYHVKWHFSVRLLTSNMPGRKRKN